MSFLYPQFFYGLLALAIPVIIHLFDFRRTRKVYFSNTRLLHQVKETTRSFYQLKHLLILIARLLFIFFLVLAFTQPFIRPDEDPALASLHVGLYIDNSKSMMNRIAEDESGLSVAKELGEQITQLYPTDAQFKILTNNKHSVAYYKDRAESIQFLRDISVGSTQQTMGSLLAQLTNQTLTTTPGEVYLISDFQRSTFGDMRISSDSTTRLHLVPIKFLDNANVAVDTLFIQNPFEIDKEKLSLKIVLKNFGDEQKESLPVKVFLNNNQVLVTMVTIEPRSNASFEFNLGFDLPEISTGRVVLDDYPVSFDNNFYFTINLGEQIRVLSISEDRSGDYLSSVYGSRDLFDFQSEVVTNLNYATLQDAGLIVVNGLNHLDKNLLNQLEKAWTSGITILIVPGIKPDIESFNSLMPGITMSDNSEMTPLAIPDFRRPFFENMVENQQKSITMPTAKDVWQWGADRNSLLKFLDGRPFLSEIRPHLFVMASPLLDSMSDFQTHALFVPVMYKIASRQGFVNQRLYNRLNDHEIKIHVDSISSRDIVRLKNKTTEIIPDQRIINQEVALSVPGDELGAGVYDVMINGFRRTQLALNDDLHESDLSVYNFSDLVEMFGDRPNVEVIDAVNASDVIDQLKTKYEGISLWRYFVALSLLFLLVEVLLIRFL